MSATPLPSLSWRGRLKRWGCPPFAHPNFANFSQNIAAKSPSSLLLPATHVASVRDGADRLSCDRNRRAEVTGGRGERGVRSRRGRVVRSGDAGGVRRVVRSAGWRRRSWVATRLSVVSESRATTHACWRARCGRSGIDKPSRVAEPVKARPNPCHSAGGPCARVLDRYKRRHSGASRCVPESLRRIRAISWPQERSPIWTLLSRATVHQGRICEHSRPTYRRRVLAPVPLNDRPRGEPHRAGTGCTADDEG
jgi:hypothetical protein